MRSLKGHWWWLLLPMVSLAVAAALVAWQRAGHSGATVWHPAFIAPMHGPIQGDPLHDDQALRFDHVTLRQFVPWSWPSRVLRVRISNEFGDEPLRIDDVRVAWREGSSGPRIRDGTSRPALFAGEKVAEVAPGQVISSDPVALPAGEPGDLAISIYLPSRTPRASWHLVGSRSSFRSAPGNHVDAVDFPVADTGRSLYFLTGVDVQATPTPRLWVAFGDSITDGAWTDADRDGSWPAQWAQAWRAGGRDSPAPEVLNAGVAGNRLLSSRDGPSGLDRFDRDVLGLKGLRGVVMLIGINDLGGRAPTQRWPDLVDQLIDAQSLLVGKAHARGVKVIGATLTPVGGSFYGGTELERARQQFNRWVRQTDLFDAVVDFDAAIRDPAAVDRIRAEWTSDHLHPNEAGYRMMAQAVIKTLADAGLERR